MGIYSFKPGCCDECGSGHDVIDANLDRLFHQRPELFNGHKNVSARDISHETRRLIQQEQRNGLPIMFYFMADCGGDSLTLCRECLKKALGELEGHQ